MQYPFSPGNELINGCVCEAFLGAGNCGTVWKALAPGGVPVAVKIIDRRADDQGRRREQHALEVVKSLQHPFLVRLHAFYPQPEHLFLVMDLADCSLKARLEECRNHGLSGVPVAELLNYVREAAETLDYLHGQQLIHGNVKPANILLVWGRIRLADLGLARLQEEGALGANRFLGTPAYTAPEGWQGHATAWSDQYSLACTYAELRLGRLPFRPRNLLRLVSNHRGGAPDLGDLPKPEKNVLGKAMHREGSRRYRSCADFYLALLEACFPRTRSSHQPAGAWGSNGQSAGSSLVRLGTAVADWCSRLLFGKQGRHGQPFTLERCPPLLTCQPGKSVELPVRVRRRGFHGPIQTALLDLPWCVEATGTLIPEGSKLVPLRVKALPDARPREYPVRVRAEGGGHQAETVTRLVVDRKDAYVQVLPPPPLTVEAGEKFRLSVGLVCKVDRGPVLVQCSCPTGGVSTSAVVVVTAEGKNRVELEAQASDAGPEERLLLLTAFAGDARATAYARILCVPPGASPWKLLSLDRPEKGKEAEVVNRLATWLDNSDPRLRGAAAAALADLGRAARDTVPALLQRLKDGVREVRQRAGFALGAMASGMPGVVPALAQLLEDDAQGPARVALADCRAAEEDVGALIEILGNGSVPARVAAADALARLGPAASAAVPQLVRNVAEPRTATAAACALGRIGPAARKARPALLRMLGRSQEPSALAAARALGQIDQAAGKSLPVLVSLLSSTNQLVALEAAEVLAEMESEAERATLALARALTSDRPSLRSFAARALGRIGRGAAAALPELAKTVADENREAAWEAILALRRIGPGSEAVTALADALLSSDAAIAVAAAHTFAQMPCHGDVVIPRLVQLLSSATTGLRYAAAWALGGYGGSASAAVAALTTALEDTDPEVRRACARALGEIGCIAVGELQKGGIPVELLPLARVLVKDPEEKVRQAAARTLARL
jgi:HEAT repeat protein